MKTRITNPTTSKQQLATSLLVFFLASCPSYAYGFAGGTGEPNDPYQIATARQLISIGTDPDRLRSHFVLVNDIDLDPNLPGGRSFNRAVIAPDLDNAREGFQGIPFAGSFNGYGHTISNLVIDAVGGHIGMFGKVDRPGRIQYLGLERTNLHDRAERGWHCSGGLAGENWGCIIQCFSSGIIQGSVKTGMLVGDNQGMISDCYARGAVTGDFFVGGLVGNNEGIVSRAYAATTVSVLTVDRVGGLIGQGLSGTTAHCFFLDPYDNGGPANGYGTALSSDQMIRRDSFVNWDFCGWDADGKRETWFMPTDDYPLLAWQTDQTGLVWLPEITGRALDHAVTILDDKGMQLGDIRWDYNAMIPYRKVIRLSPAHPVSTDAVVDVLVSQGPHDWQRNLGNGSLEYPFEIETAGQLDCLTQRHDLWDKHFVLNNDLDLSGYVYGSALLAPDADVLTPSFQGQLFNGSFKGNGFAIHGLTICSNGQYVGLWGNIGPAGGVNDLHLSDAQIIGQVRQGDAPGSGGGGRGRCGTGILAGENNGEVLGCYSDGMVVGQTEVGGLIGHNRGRVSQCSHRGFVTGTDHIGGLVGYNQETIDRCYTDCSTVSAWHGGGLAGTNEGVVQYAYSLGTMKGSGHSLGGLIGQCEASAQVTHCYTTTQVADLQGMVLPRGLVGEVRSDSAITACYFLDPEIGMDFSTVPGIPLTAAQMRQSGSFRGWDFYGNGFDGITDHWVMRENGLPALAWQTEITGLQEVPDLTDLSIDQATAVLNAAGFSLINIEYDYDQTSPLGQVLKQAYWTYSLQDRVDLVLSAGPYNWLDNPGDGSSSNPYQIGSPGQLDSLSWHPELWARHFVLTNDINMNGRSYTNALLGKDQDAEWGFQGTPFTGTLDGQYFVVIGLEAMSDEEFMGLFGKIGPGGMVRNLGLEDVQVRGRVRQVIRECGTGGLAGENWGDITNCYVTGSVSGTEEVGALVGHNEGIIADCCARGMVTGHKILGGLAGYNLGQVTNSYADVAVTGRSSPVGGLVGSNAEQITNCYAVGPLLYESGRIPGGGLVGSNYGRVVFSFWDMQTSGASMSNGGFGRTTEQMKTITTFVGWGDAHWTISNGEDYPRLAWEHAEGEVIENIPTRTYAGQGDPNSPFVLLDAQDLLCLMSRHHDWNACFELGNHIDMNGVEAYLPPSDFRGTLDGENYEIRNLSIRDNTDALGLIGRLGGGTISNLGLISIQIVGTANSTSGALTGYNNGRINSCWASGSVSGQSYAGGLVGYNNGAIHDCHATANIQGNNSAGGLVGYGHRNSSITQSSAAADVTTKYTAGGLAGYHAGRLDQCYAVGSISCSGYGATVGGLVGRSSASRITDCYSGANVTSEGMQSITGGLVGENYRNTQIQNCFSVGSILDGATKGGLVGKGNRLSVYDSFWDKGISGLTESAGGIGCTTSEMMHADIYSLNGWAHDPNWVLDVGQDYPRLAWEGTVGQAIPNPVLNWIDGSGTESDPFEIVNADQLARISNASVFWNDHIALGRSIDLDGAEWHQAIIQRFGGVFEGNNHSIANMHIVGNNYLGLIGALESGARIRDITIADANVVGTGDNAGILIGSSAGDVENCHSTGQIRGAQWVGGLIGQHANGQVTNSSSTATISGNRGVGGLIGSSNKGEIADSHAICRINGGGTVGGLVGSLSNGNLTGCYSISAINGSADIGGLVGQSSGNIVQSYSQGEVSGSRNIGGLVGYNHWGDIENCFSTCAVNGERNVAGLVGENSHSSVINSFCDIQASTTNIVYNKSQYNPGTITNAQGLATDEMQTALPYLEAGWDFDSVWMICQGQDYPKLQWEQVECNE